NFKSGSVRGLIATWGYYLKKKVCYGLYSTQHRSGGVILPIIFPQFFVLGEPSKGSV
ncbi:hypothetical protein C5S35_01800, partial [Candidatus Methanophagaceae archaeon]